jgi:hypothetical protein
MIFSRSMIHQLFRMGRLSRVYLAGEIGVNSSSLWINLRHANQ